MPPDEARLRRWAPRLRYDVLEAFFADHPAQMLINPGNTLRRAPAGGKPGAVLATATPTAGKPRLGWEGPPGPGRLLLGSKSYSDGTHVLQGDELSIAGRDYRTQYVKLREAHPELRNKIVAREVTDPGTGRLWLQYWFWYFYNDYHLAANFGLHEGDWEMVQLRFAGDAPDLAVYAQHANAERRPWDEVERTGPRNETPLVYSARGSHASYFEPGLYRPASFDIAGGQRAAKASDLVVLDDAQLPGWAAWHGQWGDTEPQILSGLESRSPPGPVGHMQWSNPQWLADKAVARQEPLVPADAPEIGVSRVRDRVALHYDFTQLPREDAPVTVAVNVNSAELPDEPPRTFTFNVEDQEAATIVTSIALAPGRDYEAHVATTSAAGVPSAPLLRELPGHGEQAAPPGR